MNKIKVLGMIANILFFGVILIAVAPRVQAQDESRSMEITFSQSVQIPGRILPPGTYIFQRRMVGVGANENMIQILNAADSRVIAFIQTIPATRKNISGDIELTFATNLEGQPPALVSCSLPGSLGGHEFLYTRRIERRVEKEQHVVVAANSRNEILIPSVAGD